MRRETETPVSCVTGEGKTDVEKPLAEAPAPRVWHDQEQAQSCHLRISGPDTEDGPQPTSIPHDDEGAFLSGVMVADVGGEDLGHERLEARVEPFVAGIEDAVLLDQPAGIADLEVSEDDSASHETRVTVRPLRDKRLESTGLRLGSRSQTMGIDKESDISANLQIGPTTLGMVRIYVEGGGFEIPLDFDPEEAEEIAEEIRAAAARARSMGDKKPKVRR